MDAFSTVSLSRGNKSTYHRHQPEHTLLYQIVERYWPEFCGLIEAQGKSLPLFIQKEFEDYLRCGLLEHGFLRVRCDNCHDEKLVAFSCKRRGICPSCGARRMAESAALLVDGVLPERPIRQWVLTFPFQLRFLFASYPEIMSKVLGIVYRVLSTHLAHKGGFKACDVKSGAVTLIQRFGSALNLNIHYHMLFLDGVYVNHHDKVRFVRTKAPTISELTVLVHRISQRVGAFLERRGLLVRDMETSYLMFDEPSEEDELLQNVLGHSITYRVATGPQQGQKVLTLQTIAPQPVEEESSDRVAKVSGFSLHAGVMAESHERKKLEHLCRYITRPPIAEQRLSLTSTGNVRYALKTPFRDGTTHVIFNPLDFIGKLVALIPRPRVNLTRYHGVFAPNCAWRAGVSPSRRGKRQPDIKEPKLPTHQTMTWSRRLKRVFSIDINPCQSCAGHVRIIACIEEPEVIKKILNHLYSTGKLSQDRLQLLLPEDRGPPKSSLY